MKLIEKFTAPVEHTNGYYERKAKFEVYLAKVESYYEQDDKEWHGVRIAGFGTISGMKSLPVKKLLIDSIGKPETKLTLYVTSKGKAFLASAEKWVK